jgi:hypothetical protein
MPVMCAFGRTIAVLMYSFNPVKRFHEIVFSCY